MNSFKKSVSDFAEKLRDVPKEIREMSGVPSPIRQDPRPQPAKAVIQKEAATPQGEQQ